MPYTEADVFESLDCAIGHGYELDMFSAEDIADDIHEYDEQFEGIPPSELVPHIQKWKNLRVNSERLTYFTDRKRHLVCVPYSIENLHRMADELGIKRCWFHKHHYDIPKRRIAEIEAKCEIVTDRIIVQIIRKKLFT